MQPMLEMKNILKTFGTFTALDDVSLKLHKGEVLGLVGENGAGKSTLLKVLCGVYRMDAGEIQINGQVARITSVESSKKAGICIIYQELSLITTLSVVENIYLKTEKTYGKGGSLLHPLNSKEMEASARMMLRDQLGADIDVRTPVEELSLGQRQVVEIARALSSNAEIIIMDEPTAALEQRERDKLFEIIRNLKNAGKSVIFVSHSLEELLGVCDTVMVLRDGRVVGRMAAADVDISNLISLMIGKTLSQQYVKRTVKISGELLRVEGFSDAKHFHDVNFTLRRGEIIGFAGLEGCGKNEMVRAIFGARKNVSGRIFKDGKPCQAKNPAAAIRNGIGFLPAERKSEGLLAQQTIRWNTTIANIGQVIRNGCIRSELEKKYTREYIRSMNIKTGSVEQHIGELSGGNQQKVMVARWLFTHADVLMLEEPTRGIDVNSKTEIYEYIMKCVEEDKGIIIVSSELPELVGICDRIFVFNRGRILAELKASETSQSEITRYAVNI